MQDLDGTLVVSPTDLTRYLACEHATRLDLAVAQGRLSPPADAVEETLQALFTRGIEHEADYLRRLREQGRTVVEIPFTDSASLVDAELATEQAMAAGAEVIYQATFFDGRWRGHADFLLRRDDRQGRWAWSYDVADTKLARRTKVPALLQMATYAERLALLQGIAPELLIVVTGDGVEQSYRFADCAAYAAAVRQRFLDFLADRDAAEFTTVTPEPVAHCSQCRWQPRCRGQWRAQDDLSLVAFMRRDHARILREADIGTVRELGSLEPASLPGAIGESSRVRLAAQARLQLVERDTGEPSFELLDADVARGLALLPEPSVGDVFFDMEGDPFLGDHGLEYLFGVVAGGEFTAYWATDSAAEKDAFERLIDHLMGAWAADPGMHVYHYASYEPSRLKSLSGRYGTRSAEVDRLLRGQRLVDLYAVVRQGVRVSKESYSIKKLESFYWGHDRAKDGVSDALGSVVAFERWRLSRDQRLLDDIASYNEDDCRSTEALRDWLEKPRGEGGGDEVYPRPSHTDGLPSIEVEQASTDVQRVMDALMADVAGESVESSQARVLLAGLLDWHRRESLPQWWDFFARQQLSDEELIDDPAALGLLSDPVAIGTDKLSTLWRLRFAPQETKVGPGEGYIDPHTGKAAPKVVAINAEDGSVVVKLATRRGRPTCTSLVPSAPLNDVQQRARLLELGEWVLAHSIDDPSPQWRAARDLLLRRRPRVSGSVDAALLGDSEAAELGLQRCALELTDGVLAVQGPPGTGKTWAGARLVLGLVAAGKRVGIAAFSHKAISNALDAICDAAAETGQPVRVLQKAATEQRCAAALVNSTDDPNDVEAALAASSVDVIAGTAWLYARPGLQAAVDVLVIDEAGQLSLANVLAVSGAARSIVLLGDPQQLAQPVQGQHPPGAGASALEHLLDGSATIAPDRGILLDTTWRMHPSIAEFVSTTSYDARLRVEPGCARQVVESAALLGGAGLRLVTVEHHDNAAASTEEAEIVRQLCLDVLADGRWVDRTGSRRRLLGSDILILTPFNAQVNRIRSRLGRLVEQGIRVGTVDRFQGQEAPIVIYSTAASSVRDAPRGIDFLYSLNRFNVAVSRARGVVAVVCSPQLLAPLVTKPGQLREVNALASFAAAAVRG